MKHVFLFLKGILFGIANLIPGLSGGTIAVITGVYEKLLDCINNLFKNFKKSIIFLAIYGAGAVFAILAGAKGLDWLLKYFELPITLLFVGLILGSLKTVKEPLKKKLNKKVIIIMILACALVVGLLFIPKQTINGTDLKFYDYILLGVCGFLASVAMVVPGISGMMMFYIFGYYEVLMGALSGITSSFGSSILVLLPVGIGIVVGIFTAAKVIAYLLKKFPTYTFAGIFGFVIGSIFALLYEGGTIQFFIDLFRTHNLKAFLTRYENEGFMQMWASFVVGIMFLLMGIMISNFIINLSNKKEEPVVEKKSEDELKREVEEELKADMKGLTVDEYMAMLSKKDDNIDKENNNDQIDNNEVNNE